LKTTVFLGDMYGKLESVTPWVIIKTSLSKTQFSILFGESRVTDVYIHHLGVLNISIFDKTY